MRSPEKRKEELLQELADLKAELRTAADQVAVAAAKVRLEIIKEEVRLLGLRDLRASAPGKDRLSIVR